MKISIGIIVGIYANFLLMGWTLADIIPSVIESQVFKSGLKQPSALAVDSDNGLYVLDGLNQRIVQFKPDGKLNKIIPLQIKPAEKPFAPMDILLTPSSFFISDPANHRILEFNLQGQLHDTIYLSQRLKTSSTFPEPTALWLDEQQLYWSDRANHQICQMKLPKKQIVRCFGTYGEGKAQFRFPYQMAMDRDGYLHTVDVLNGRVLIFNSRGKYFSQLSRFGIRQGELFRPNGIAVDKSDFVFIADSYLGNISIFKSGRFLAYLKDSNGQQIQFNTPVYLKLIQNNLYVVDALGNSVWRLSLSYEVTGHKKSKSSTKPALSSKKNCISCHLSWANKKDFKKLVITDRKVLPVASEKMCYSCHHGVVVESRVAMIEKHQHPSIYSATDKKNKQNKNPEKTRLSEQNQDSIPEIFPLSQVNQSEQQQLLCSSCHTPHNSDEEQEVLYQDHENAWLRVSNQNGNLCERCHQSKGNGARALDKSKQKPKEDTYSNHPLGIRFSPKNKKDNWETVKEAHLEKGLPNSLAVNGGVLDKQKRLICQTCHQIHAGKENDLLVLSNQHSQLCVSCHQSKTAKSKKAAHQKGIHPINIDLEEPITHKGKTIKRVNCDTCHKVHNGKADSALLWEPDQGAGIEELCIICHQRHNASSKEDALEKGVHPVNIKLDESIEIAGKKTNKVTCLSCHSVHKGKKHTAVLLESDNNGQLCQNCHKEQQAVKNTDHDLRITAKDSKNHQQKSPKEAGLCGSCHSMHQGYTDKNKFPLLYTAKTVDATTQQKQTMNPVLLKRDQLCINCHQEKGIGKDKVVNHFSHPYQDMVLRSDPAHMPLIKSVESETIHEFGMIACISCHNPHRWEPGDKENQSQPGKNIEGNGKNSFLHHTDVMGSFCLNCHGIETRIKYKYYHDKKNARGIGIEYLK